MFDDESEGNTRCTCLYNKSIVSYVRDNLTLFLFARMSVKLATFQSNKIVNLLTSTLCVFQWCICDLVSGGGEGASDGASQKEGVRGGFPSLSYSLLYLDVCNRAL